MIRHHQSNKTTLLTYMNYSIIMHCFTDKSKQFFIFTHDTHITHDLDWVFNYLLFYDYQIIKSV